MKRGASVWPNVKGTTQGSSEGHMATWHRSGMKREKYIHGHEEETRWDENGRNKKLRGGRKGRSQV